MMNNMPQGLTMYIVERIFAYLAAVLWFVGAFVLFFGHSHFGDTLFLFIAGGAVIVTTLWLVMMAVRI